MAAIWHWVLTLLASLNIIAPISEVPVPEPVVIIEQEFGDTPQVAGVSTGFPEADMRLEAHRSSVWEPPQSDELTAESIMIMDKNSGKILWSRSPEKVWPLASITKLMGAIVFMEERGNDADIWQDTHIMTAEDVVDGTIYIYQGEEVTVDDLFHFSLVGSINTAARALFHSVELEDDEVIEKMNAYARSKGFWNTQFFDVTGLSSENVTTAKEAAWIVKEALSYDKIRETLIKDSYTITTNTGRKTKVLNTNKLLGGDFTIEGGKTGYITESKYNFAASIMNEQGDAVIIVVLGTDEQNLRFTETATLAEWAFDNYEWK